MLPSPPEPEIVYIYRGDGLGIPGMPHELTRSQAAALGVLDLLETAIVSGVYQPAEE